MSPLLEGFTGFVITAVWVLMVFVVFPGVMAVAGTFLVGAVASLPILVVGCLVRLVRPARRAGQDD